MAGKAGLAGILGINRMTRISRITGKTNNLYLEHDVKMYLNYSEVFLAESEEVQIL